MANYMSERHHWLSQESNDGKMIWTFRNGNVRADIVEPFHGDMLSIYNYDGHTDLDRANAYIFCRIIAFWFTNQRLPKRYEIFPSEGNDE